MATRSDVFTYTVPSILIDGGEAAVFNRLHCELINAEDRFHLTHMHPRGLPGIRCGIGPHGKLSSRDNLPAAARPH